MQDYKKILLAADFTDHGNLVAKRAADLAGKYQAELCVLHVVDSIPIAESIYGPVIPYEGELSSELVRAAEKRLVEIGEQFAIPLSRQWVELGSPKLEIIRVASENDIDLIVVGSHGRHGLGLLLGSTANGVLHYAECDVMAVRLHDPK